ncbi:NAD(P)/FAD-dependent oxidoreductase [Rhabdobacter roseus]|nr:NAD(P)/FAD-dependent oxidoreductase [Rhabdobacter roseus]
MQLVIIGGGAAGFMAAITAAEKYPAAEVLLLEKNRTVLNKVRVSGGGRCNVTHACFDNRRFVKQYPRGEALLKKLFAQFDAAATVEWFRQRGVLLSTEPDGRMFPTTNSSETIIDCLQRAARQAGVRIRTSAGVRSFSWSDSPQGTRFALNMLDESTLPADRLIIASGGHPQRSGFEWLGHAIEEPVPSLFTFNAPDSYLLPLSGVAVPDAHVRLIGTRHDWRGPVLLTHWGFSGPAILKLSAWGARELAAAKYQFGIKINWLPEQNEEQVRTFLIQEKQSTPRQQISSHARFGLPLRLWKAFVQRAEITDSLRWMDAPHKVLNRLADLLTNSQFEIRGKSTYKEEFVTAGGVRLSEVHTDTLESKRVPGLFFAGEVLDVDGITGGFNFQNAWTTGYVAGMNAGKAAGVL